MADATYAFPPAPIATLAIAGASERFPVNRIFCVGRNYAAHVKEMGADEREPPFFFMKPGSAAVDASAEVGIAYPPMTSNFHHEIELVVVIGKAGREVAKEQAEDLVFGYAVGLDMTRRDLQFAARDKGRPWEFGKSFSQSAPIGAIARAADVGHPRAAGIMLAVNGKIRQSSDVKLMIWSVPECIAFLSKHETLQPGDVLMTGTPEGVGAVVAGDVMQGHIDGLDDIRVRVDG